MAEPEGSAPHRRQLSDSLRVEWSAVLRHSVKGAVMPQYEEVQLFRSLKRCNFAATSKSAIMLQHEEMRSCSTKKCVNCAAQVHSAS